MKRGIFSRRAERDPALDALRGELAAARGALSLAYRRFDLATDPELVESCVFEISAAKARCNYLIRAIKARCPDGAEEAAWI